MMPRRSPADAALARRRREVHDECERLGVRVTQKGGVFHLLGRGVDIRVTDLSFVHADDFADMRRERSNDR